METSPSYGDPIEIVLRHETTRELHKAIRDLPTRQSALVELHYLSEHSQDEFAELLAIPPGSIKTTLARARARLRATLSQSS